RPAAAPAPARRLGPKRPTASAVQPDDAEHVALGREAGDTQRRDVPRPLVDAVAIPARRPDGTDDPAHRGHSTPERDRRKAGHRLAGLRAHDPFGAAAVQPYPRLGDGANIAARQVGDGHDEGRLRVADLRPY